MQLPKTTSMGFSFQQFVVVLYIVLVLELLMLPSDALAALNLSTLRAPDGETLAKNFVNSSHYKAVHLGKLLLCLNLPIT